LVVVGRRPALRKMLENCIGRKVRGGKGKGRTYITLIASRLVLVRWWVLQIGMLFTGDFLYDFLDYFVKNCHGKSSRGMAGNGID